MFGKLITSFAIVASLGTAVVPTAATARDHDRYDNSGYGDYGRGDRYDNGRHGGYRNDGYRNDRRYRDGRYDNRRGYYGQQAYGGGYGNYYRGRDRYRCHNNGSTGTIVGAIAGGLLGNGIAGRGDRTLGTVLGAGGGALAGRAIDRSGNRC